MRQILLYIFLLIGLLTNAETKPSSSNLIVGLDIDSVYILKKASIKSDAVKQFFSEVFYPPIRANRHYFSSEDNICMIVNEGMGQEYSIEFKWVKPSDGQLFEGFDSDNRTISLTKIDGVPVYVNSPEGCNLLDFAGGNVRIHRRYYVDVVGVLMGSYEVESYRLYYRGGRLEIVNHINDNESEEQLRRLVGTVFYDSGCSEYEDGICSAAESQGSQRRYYVPIVKVTFRALRIVLERDVIPFVRRYSFMSGDGSIFVELAEASVKISFFPNLRTFSPYWEDNLVRSSTYKKAAIFYLRGRPIRIHANRGNPHVELTESNETYSFITVGAPEWLDETYDSHIWEYDIVDGQLVPIYRLK